MNRGTNQLLGASAREQIFGSMIGFQKMCTLSKQSTQNEYVCSSMRHGQKAVHLCLKRRHFGWGLVLWWTFRKSTQQSRTTLNFQASLPTWSNAGGAWRQSFEDHFKYVTWKLACESVGRLFQISFSTCTYILSHFSTFLKNCSCQTKMLQDKEKPASTNVFAFIRNPKKITSSSEWGKATFASVQMTYNLAGFYICEHGDLMPPRYPQSCGSAQV